jgi:integral membrane sensor domain MASE1
MRWALSALGVALALAGGVFTLQGIGILPGSFMSNNPQWIINGGITMLIGIGLIVWANWPKKKQPPSS